mmetsp:Transcript_6063/g.14550  ORF Transcript_6063/g.14550 Transcript_6063/m.14550 type:complete len:85 (+) Transcript_6063:683-937(+)
MRHTHTHTQEDETDEGSQSRKGAYEVSPSDVCTIASLVCTQRQTDRQTRGRQAGREQVGVVTRNPTTPKRHRQAEPESACVCSA